MAKKISKHSRAARRGQVPQEQPVSVPKQSLENDGVRKSIIRTQIKNENLLSKKLESSKIHKQSNKKKTSSLKNKLIKSDKLQGVLSSKIEASIARAKYVQNSRKSNWDKTNSNIQIRNHMVDELNNNAAQSKQGDNKKLTEMEIEKLEEDEYVRKFYEDENENVEGDKDAKIKNQLLSKNRFAALDDIEV
ncbi:ECM1 [Candida oxycetoniae]|uniref:ECM1 n=1 Tax=Candida oxycetoniae TaxID=497107 RepID=A0AAI9T1G4_9ASCO|nr:ECM1 [Candida oxycetoniae]KAI3406695.2 ECM1 [Candida oxycetoniae]